MTLRIEPLGWVGIILIILKLTSVIAWPWWAVTLPFWIIFPAAIVAYTIVGIHSLLSYIAKRL